MCVIEAAEAAAAEMTGEAGEAVGAGGERGSEELEVVGRSDKSTGKSITRLTLQKSLYLKCSTFCSLRIQNARLFAI
jgi:hypothetical protein